MNRRTVALLTAAAVVLGTAVLVLAGLPVSNWLSQFLVWTDQIGPLGPFVLAGLYVLACILMIPGSLLTMGAGFLFGIVLGTVTVSLASTAGATAAFLLGRSLARPLVAARVSSSPRFAAIDAGIGQEGLKLVFLLRLTPVLPFNLLNYTLGLTRVRLRDYVLGSWVGMLPGTILYVYVGSAVKSISDLAAGNVEGGLGQRVFFAVGLVATVVVTGLLTRIARRALKEVVSAEC